MSKIYFFLLLVLSTSTSCYTQTNSDKRIFHSKEFNWTIAIPQEFETFSAEEWERIEKRGKDALEKTVETEIVNNTKKILLLRTDQFNYFEVNYQLYTQDEVKDYDEITKDINKILYQTLKDNITEDRVDSSSAKEKIGGLEFHLFKVNIQLPNDQVMEMRLYSRLFGLREFTVSTVTVDAAKRARLLEALRASSFAEMN